MKKFFLAFSFIAGVFLLFNTNVYSATPQCDAVGGKCKLFCNSLNEDNPYGKLDCPAGTGGPRSSTCCVEVTPGPSIPITPGSGVGNTLNMMDSIPGITCGVPYNPQGTAPAELKNKICSFGTFKCDGIISKDFTNGVVDFASKIPIVGGLVAGAWQGCLDAEERITAYNKNFKSECIFGKVENFNGNLLCITNENVIDNKLTERLTVMCNKHEKDFSDLSACLDCAAHSKYYTAIGCVSLDLKSFISETLLGLGVSLGGLFALLCIIYSAFRMQTSQGNPETIKKAQETLTSCILGLILIIFSIFILRFIGVNILKIPFLQ